MLLDHFGMYPERAFQKVGNRMTLEGGGKSSPPPAPDYTAAAQQTSAGNIATARLAQTANMVNQYTPQGSVVYKPTTTGYISPTGRTMGLDEYNWNVQQGKDVGEYNPVEQWSQTVTLSPEQKAAYEQDTAMNARLRDVANQGIDYVQQALNKPLESPGQAVGSAGTTAMVGSAQTFNTPSSIAEAGKIQRDLGTPTINVTGEIAPTTQKTIGSVENPELIKQLQNAGKIRTDIKDPELVLQQVTDALYNQQAQYLDPQFIRQQKTLETQLANQGIARGSEAWNESLGEFARQKQQAYESARSQAIASGVGAAQGMFGMQLSGLQAANAAQAQQYGQNLGTAQFTNAAQGQQFNQSLANAQLANSLQAQQFGQNLSTSQFQNAANAQQIQNLLATGQFANAAQAQQFAQNQAQQQAAAQAAAQNFYQSLSNAQLANQAAQQTYAQQLSNAQLQNQALQQNFANAQTLRQEPINILNAVRTGSQLNSAQQPQVNVSAPGQMATVSGPDYLSAATATGQYNQGLYNAQQASQNNLTSGLFGLGGAGIMSYGMMAA